jgi:hypothetical protein
MAGQVLQHRRRKDVALRPGIVDEVMLFEKRPRPGRRRLPKEELPKRLSQHVGPFQFIENTRAPCLNGISD